MHIGGLRKRVTVEAETQTPDGAGGYGLTWTTIATLWADIKPIDGREVLSAQHLEGRVTHQVTLRWQNDAAITTDMRLTYGTRHFNIRAVIDSDERNRWTELLVEEGGAQ